MFWLIIESIIDRIKNKIESGSYLFKPYKVKLNLLQDNNVSLEEKARIIKSLSSDNSNEQLKILFNSIGDSIEDSMILFKNLNCKDKKDSLNYIDNNFCRRELLSSMSHKELFRTALDLFVSKDRDHVISLLNKGQRLLLSFLPYYTFHSDRILLIKYSNDKRIKRALNRKHFKVLNNSDKAIVLEGLSSDQEKVECLKTPNKYNIELNKDQKRRLIESLTDEYKFNYLNDVDELNYIYGYSIDSFFYSFSKENVKKILMNKDNYKYNISHLDIGYLVAKLDKDEKLSLISSENNYSNLLTSHDICNIICTLPNNCKIDILKNKIKYNIDLGNEYIIKIITSLSIIDCINIIILNDELGLNLTKKNIWSIIENLKEKEVSGILNNKDPKIQEFIQEYKTSFVKCLNSDDKIEIIYNRSKYNIHLDDKRKIKILKSISKYASDNCLNSDNIFKYFDNTEEVVEYFITNKNEFDRLNDMFQTQLLKYYIGDNITDDELEIGIDIIKYTKNPKDILSNFNSFKEIFNYLNINIYDFFQYGSNSNKYNWYEDILNLLNDDKSQNFCKVKDYFFNNYYSINNSKDIITNFLELLNAYNKYEDFCMNIVSNKNFLIKSEKEDIRYLFNQSNIDNIPNNIEDIDNIRKEKIKSYIEIAKTSIDAFELKNALFNLLFDKSLYEINNIIKYTGGTTDLKILQFNNKDNEKIKSVTEDLILVTSLIERILNTYDINGLKKTLIYYSSEENIEHTKKICNYCSKYEELNRKLYEYDMNESLTNIKNIDKDLCNTTKARELKNKYGGKIIDLSEVQYILGAHVKSYSETVENVLYGDSDGKSNFICLSPSSHRNQHYYGWKENKTIFAYDNIPDGSFICSSICNMGSSQSLNYNSAEVPTFDRIQKNILETSEASTGHNAEILLYRAGLTPCGLIVPTNEQPSNEAIEYHEKYNLPFIITQPVDTPIENPKKINTKNNEELTIEESDNESLTELKEAITKCTKKCPKKIAVLADPHALYEPTLSCLVDIKNKGIDEIYSLGDNIGHGPSPKEVLELLDSYNVKSIYGNHELYLINGIEDFKEHFPSQESIDRTHAMNNWIKQELTEEQIQDIKKYPERYEISISKGKKLTLIHNDKPYTAIGKYSNKPVIDKASFVVKGHEHFASKSDNNIVLRGVGIGQQDTDDGYATYYIIDTTKSDNNIETVNIPYNRDNLLHTINESNMPVLAKSLIKNWVGKNK